MIWIFGSQPNQREMQKKLQLNPKLWIIWIFSSQPKQREMQKNKIVIESKIMNNMNT